VKWYDKIKLGAFVDAYASVNYNFPKPQTGVNGFRAYDPTNGFALHWAGLEASYAAEPVGGQISLRFGPGANIHNSGDAASSSLINVKQAYATWKPFSKLIIDFGKYDQPFGSEVAETQFDINYTRSALYWLAQPLFFTGFRVDIPVVDQFDIKFFLVNGWNNTIDNNAGKSAGVQFTIKPIDKISIALGYMFGPEQPDFTPATPPPAAMPAADVPNADKQFRHFLDLVVDFNPIDTFRLLLNGSLGVEDIGGQSVQWGGVNLAARYAPTEKFSIALRGEFYKDPQGFSSLAGLVPQPRAAQQNVTIEDGTLTLGYNPSPNLLLKLDGRLDHATTANGAGLFVKGVGQPLSPTQVTTTLGVVATTN